jgi:hypothetical protein
MTYSLGNIDMCGDRSDRSHGISFGGGSGSSHSCESSGRGDNSGGRRGRHDYRLMSDLNIGQIRLSKPTSREGDLIQLYKLNWRELAKLYDPSLNEPPGGTPTYGILLRTPFWSVAVAK